MPHRQSSTTVKSFRSCYTDASTAGVYLHFPPSPDTMPPNVRPSPTATPKLHTIERSYLT